MDKMEDNGKSKKKRKTTAAIVAVASIVVIIFLCIFSLYHLPERDPVETPEMVENSDFTESPVVDFQETNDIMSASQEQVSEMLGDLEMQYTNAQLNNDPYAAQQSGMRLAVAYWKAGEKQKASNLLNSLIDNYGYDQSFVRKCRGLQKIFDSPSKEDPVSK